MNLDRGKESFDEDDIAAVLAQLNDFKVAGGHSWADLARMIGDLSDKTLNAFANGNYAGDNQKVAWRVNRFFVAEADRQAQALVMPVVPGFRRTRTSQQITAQLLWAHQGEIVACVGNPGVGKTAAFDQYCMLTPNAFKATMSPATRSVVAMLQEVARAIGLQTKRGMNGSRLQQEVLARLANIRALLIIDEAQHLSDASLDQLRTIHDRTKCGIALCGNKEVMGRVRGGDRVTEFAQLYSRVSWPQVYETADADDVRVLCEAWGVLDEREQEFLRKVASLPGALRSLTQTLKMATLSARTSDEPRTLGHLKAAWTQLSRQAVF